jgi:hypothetical protein
LTKDIHYIHPVMLNNTQFCESRLKASVSYLPIATS